MMETAAREKEKYDRMHNIPGYSPGPGVAHVRTAEGYMPKGCSVIDFGTGTGDAVAAFLSRGFDAWAVDISKEGLRHDLGEKFLQGPLWALPDGLPAADWGFCCDVMEHIPPDKVEESLRQMAGRVANCFFAISGVPDSWGKKIGETLHLTVRPCPWWFARLQSYWDCIRLVEDTGSVFIFVARGARHD